MAENDEKLRAKMLNRHSALTTQHRCTILRKSLVIVLATVLIIVIVGGYFAWTNYSSQNQNDNTPSTLSVEQIRDHAMLYIAANHTQTAQLMQAMSWSGGRQDTGLLGSETYQYNSGDWSLTIQYPLVPNPTYTITANYSSSNGTVFWTGTYQNGVITETSNDINVNTQELLTQEQARDLTMQYLTAYHNQTVPYMHGLSWTGGRTTSMGMVGSETYIYQSSGWNVTMQYPVVPNAVYIIMAQYTPMNVYSGEVLITWRGTLQNGTITETAYNFNP